MQKAFVLVLLGIASSGCSDVSAGDVDFTAQSGSVCRGKKCPPVDMAAPVDMATPPDMQPTCNHLASKELLTGLDSWYTAEVAANGNFLTVNDDQPAANCLQTQIWQADGTVVGQVPNCANVGGASNAYSTIAAPDGWYAKVLIPEIVGEPEGGAGAAYDYSVVYIRPDGTIAGHVPNLDRSEGVWYYLAGDKNAAYLIYSWHGGALWKVFALEAGGLRFLQDVPYVADALGRQTFTEFFVVDGALFADLYEYEDLYGGITKVRLSVRGVYPNSARKLAVASEFEYTGFERLGDRVVSVGGSANALRVFYYENDPDLGGTKSDMLFYDAQDQLIRTLRPGNWIIDQMAPLGAGRWIGTRTVTVDNSSIERGSHVFLYNDAGIELDHLKFLSAGSGQLVNLRTSGTNAVVGRNMAAVEQVQDGGTVTEVYNTGFYHFSCTP
ncbi:MAG: hypothetical protein Q7R83_01100 [bacterium]|nr:hypothetical protein [bacterium]